MIRASTSPHCCSEAISPSHMASQRKMPVWATSPPWLLRAVSIKFFFTHFLADEGRFTCSNRTLSSNVRDFADGVVVDVEGPALPCAETRGVVWGGSAQVPCAETLASDLGRGTDIGVFPPLRPVVVGRVSKPAVGRGVLDAVAGGGGLPRARGVWLCGSCIL